MAANHSESLCIFIFIFFYLEFLLASRNVFNRQFQFLPLSSDDLVHWPSKSVKIGKLFLAVLSLWTHKKEKYRSDSESNFHIQSEQTERAKKANSHTKHTTANWLSLACTAVCISLPHTSRTQFTICRIWRILEMKISIDGFTESEFPLWLAKLLVSG